MKTLRKALNRLMINNTLCSLPTKSWKRKCQKIITKVAYSIFTLTMVGSTAGAAIGMLGGTRIVVVGAGKGAGIGGAAARKIRETNCNQQ